MSKKLLEESTIRQFMKLAQLEPLAGDFLKEGERKKAMREEEDVVEEGEKKPGKVEGDYDGDGDVDEDDVGIAADQTAKKVLGKHFQKEAMTDTMEEEMIDEMGGDYPMEETMDGLYEEEDDMEMEAEAGDMEAEINITPDQARAIIAVADMLKDIMPDLEAPEAEEEDEEEMDMEEPEMDMGAEEEAEGEEEVAAGEEEEDEGAEEEEEALAEAVMRRVKARLREMKNK